MTECKRCKEGHGVTGTDHYSNEGLCPCHEEEKPIHQINEEAMWSEERLVRTFYYALTLIVVVVITMALAGLGVLLYWATRGGV